MAHLGEWGGAEDLGKRSGCFMIIRWKITKFIYLRRHVPACDITSTSRRHIYRPQGKVIFSEVSFCPPESEVPTRGVCAYFCLLVGSPSGGGGSLSRDAWMERVATTAVGTHPTGMHSCFSFSCWSTSRVGCCSSSRYLLPSTSRRFTFTWRCSPRPDPTTTSWRAPSKPV